MADDPERGLIGGHRDKMWNYVVVLFLLIVIVVVLNLVWKNPATAQASVHHFFGLPGWALATVLFLVGALIYWIGLKIEPDWPELIGAFCMAASATWFEIIIGWQHFDIGGLIVIPYLVPIVIFLGLFTYAVRNSRRQLR